MGRCKSPPPPVTTNYDVAAIGNNRSQMPFSRVLWRDSRNRLDRCYPQQSCIGLLLSIEADMATSKLQRQVSNQLSVYFGGYNIRENIRPEWLTHSNGSRLELDFYLEDLDIAIEVQGQQHYVYTPYFHASYNDFKKQQQRDIAKRTLCQSYGITLIEIDSETKIIEMVRFIRQYIKETYGNSQSPSPHIIDTRWEEKFHSISKSLRKAKIH